jgi:Zinc carboxypeptidase
MARFSTIAFITSALAVTALAQTTPEQFFGFQLGADRKMARWDKIVEYYSVLEKESGGKMKVINMGSTTMGNPFLMVIITSPANHAKLDRLRQINLQLSDPRGIPEATIKALVAEGKPIIVQSMSLHANEIGGTQMAPEVAYDLIARKDEETQRILDNVIFIEVPSFNPDGEIMVTDYYNKYLGTEYEGGGLPYLYHKYIGHDTNRDAFQTNMIESKYMAKILFTDWKPEAYVDHHHMGSYNARIYLPPYAEPVRPGADPLLWRELSWYGAHMAYKEEEAGESGVINGAQYSGWGHFGFHWITPFHNIAGMLTESASAKIATPMYILPEQLQGGPRNMPAYEEETIFPDPWKGGWWRLRDIVDRQKISAWAVLDLAARNRETVLWNAYLKASRQTQRGAEGKPKAFVISANQHDPLTATLMINKLLVQGVEVMRVTKPISSANGMEYPAGSFVISMAQPKMGLIKNLLGRTFYPDNDWTRNKDGSPSRPYDMSTDTMVEFMGVRADPVDEAIVGDLQKLAGLPIKVAGKVETGSTLVIDGRLNNSFKAANLLFDNNVKVRRVDKAGSGIRAGDFLVTPSSTAGPTLEAIARETGVDFKAIAQGQAQAHDMKRLRIGLYQRYSGGNIDEGWTRWLIEDFKFAYKTVMDAEIKKGDLNANFDVIILPDDSTAAITGDRPAAGAAPAGRGGGGGDGEGGGGRGAQTYPPEYRSGIGNEGVTALKAFVQKGGTVVTLGTASNFAMERLGANVRNVLAGKSTKDFWCPGSTLRMKFDNSNPAAYGMPSDGVGVFLQGNLAFDITPGEHNEQYEVIASYADRDVLQSGWLLGEQNLAKKAAMVVAHQGTGKIVLIGFRAQHRAQTYGTFKLLFNALVN